MNGWQRSLIYYKSEIVFFFFFVQVGSPAKTESWNIFSTTLANDKSQVDLRIFFSMIETNRLEHSNTTPDKAPAPTRQAKLERTHLKVIR